MSVRQLSLYCRPSIGAGWPSAMADDLPVISRHEHSVHAVSRGKTAHTA